MNYPSRISAERIRSYRKRRFFFKVYRSAHVAVAAKDFVRNLFAVGKHFVLVNQEDAFECVVVLDYLDTAKNPRVGDRTIPQVAIGQRPIRGNQQILRTHQIEKAGIRLVGLGRSAQQVIVPPQLVAVIADNDIDPKEGRQVLRHDTQIHDPEMPRLFREEIRHRVVSPHLLW